MVAARFPVALEKVDARHRLVLHLEEADGKTFDFSER
jgi:hypothetical protein